MQFISQLSFTNSNTSQSFTEIPYVEVPLNKSKCPRKYTNAPLVTACDMLPLLSSPRCTPQSGCTQATCPMIRGLNTTLHVQLYNCFSPPAVGIYAYDENNQAFISDRTSNSKNIVDNRDHSTLRLTVIQHTNEMTVGVQVNDIELCKS